MYPPVYAQYPDRMQMRQKELHLIDTMIAYFSLKAQQFEEYDWCSSMIHKLSQSSAKAALIWGIIMGAAIPMFFVGIGLYDEDPVPAIVGGLFFMPVGIALIVLHFIINKRKRTRLTDVTRRYYELSEELYAHYCGYEQCPIGPEYSNPSILKVIERAMLSGRADTIKEALNILVEDAHRERIEEYSAQTVRYARQAAEYAAQTARNTADIAKNTASIGFNTDVMTYFVVADHFKR